MKNDQINEVFERWEAMFGFPLRDNQRGTWASWLGGLYALDSLATVVKVIDQLAEDYASKDEYAKKPGLAAVKAEYRKAKNHGSAIIKRSGCGLCNYSGRLAMVTALDNVRGRLRPVPKFVVVPAPRSYVYTLPCSCDKGEMVNRSLKTATQAEYSRDQVEKLVEICGYGWERSDNGQMLPPDNLAEAWRARCEEWFWKLKITTARLSGSGKVEFFTLPADYQAAISLASGTAFSVKEMDDGSRLLMTSDPSPVLEYYHKKEPDQAIGFDANGKEINGFLQNERNYQPPED